MSAGFDWLTVLLVAAATVIVFRAARAWRRPSRDLSGPPQAPPAISAELRADLAALLAAGHKIEAIKQLRDATGLGLREAKDAVESIEAIER